VLTNLSGCATRDSNSAVSLCDLAKVIFWLSGFTKAPNDQTPGLSAARATSACASELRSGDDMASASDPRTTSSRRVRIGE
jgi:hypothetical protein